MRKLYATDFHLWAKETAQLLRERRFEDIEVVSALAKPDFMVEIEAIAVVD